MIADQTGPLPVRRLTQPRFERIGALAALLGVLLSYFGLSWDIQWHADVGPDTFWTLPHLFVYSGSALSGLACLSVSLISSRLYRTLADASWISVLSGRFHAPLGFVVAGLGSLGFLLFGFFDQWWHLIYGFDVTLNSPPHIGLLLSLIVSMVGSSLIFVQRRLRPLEFTASVAVTLGFALPLMTLLFRELHQTFQYVLFPVMFLSVGLLLVASVTRNAWWVLGLGLSIAALRAANWYGVPLFDQSYAQALGYAVRDDARGFSYVAFLTPSLIPFAGLVVSGLLTVWRRLGWNAALGAAGAAGLAAPVLYLDGATIQLGQMPALIPVVMVLGAGFGWLGWQLGVVFRHSGGVAAPSTVPATPQTSRG